jgi:hypothetical protein
MTLSIFMGYPPDRESAVAAIHERHDGLIDVPAQIVRDGGELVIELFSREGTGPVPQWTYPLDEFVRAIEAGRAALDSS